MNNGSKNLYFLGGLTAILGGLLMGFTSIWFIVQADQHADIMHGISVGMIILIVPTVVATTVLLIKDAKIGALLGVGFAVLWIVLELIAHCSQTAPLKTLNELIPEEATQDAETAIKWIWQEWGLALTLISAFLYSVAALCYGISLRLWGNPASAYLLILSAVAFPITFIPGVDLNWHILIRSIAFLFLGGVLLQARRETNNEEWEV